MGSLLFQRINTFSIFIYCSFLCLTKSNEFLNKIYVYVSDERAHSFYFFHSGMHAVTMSIQATTNNQQKNTQK